MSVFLIFLVIHYFVRHTLGYDHIMAFQPVLGKRDVRVYIEPSLEKGGFGIEHPFVIGAAVILIDNRGGRRFEVAVVNHALEPMPENDIFGRLAGNTLRGGIVHLAENFHIHHDAPLTVDVQGVRIILFRILPDLVYFKGYVKIAVYRLGVQEREDERQQAGGGPDAVLEFIAEVEHYGEEPRAQQHDRNRQQAPDTERGCLLARSEHFPQQEPVVIPGGPVQDGKQNIDVGHEVVVHESRQGGQGKYNAAQQQIDNQFLIVEQFVFPCDKIGCNPENHSQHGHQQVR